LLVPASYTLEKTVKVRGTGKARSRVGSYEVLAMMRKGQVKGFGGNDIVVQTAFVNSLFDLAA